MTGALLELSHEWGGNPERYHAMASKDTIGSQTAKAGTPPFLNWGQTDAAMAVQKAFLESCDQASRSWLTRMQSEVSLWSDLANKLSTTQSVPEAVEAYSKCVSQRMQMAANDARQFVDESQQIMQKVTHSLSNGWPRATT
jgi:hypothetical protein